MAHIDLNLIFGMDFPVMDVQRLMLRILFCYLAWIYVGSRELLWPTLIGQFSVPLIYNLDSILTTSMRDLAISKTYQKLEEVVRLNCLLFRMSLKLSYLL